MCPDLLSPCGRVEVGHVIKDNLEANKSVLTKGATEHEDDVLVHQGVVHGVPQRLMLCVDVLMCYMIAFVYGFDMSNF